MEPWPYIIAAYACTIGGTVILTVWSFVRMRSNEARAAALRDRVTQLQDAIGEPLEEANAKQKKSGRKKRRRGSRQTAKVPRPKRG